MRGGGLLATVLAILTSGRRHGFTARLLDAAIEGIESVNGVDAEMLHSHRYRFGPCTSCFACIRDPKSGCVLDDDMGGRGGLSAGIERADGLLIADPVHNWSPSASARLLVERCYPFTWTGTLSGMPSASISCASNQGMHLLARRELCKYLFGMRTLYVGGVAAHVAHFDHALEEARALGMQLGEAAVAREHDGRVRLTDADAFAHYTMTAPWSPLDAYIENIAQGGPEPTGTLMDAAIRDATITRPDAVAEVTRAQDGFAEALRCKQAGDVEQAARLMASATAHWTGATWKQFLEDEVIGVEKPPAYRPTDNA